MNAALARGSAVGCVLIGCLMLDACGGGSSSADSSGAPTQTGESLGLMKLTVSGLGGSAVTSHVEMLTAPDSSEMPRTFTTAPQGIDVKQVSSSSVDVGTNAGGGTRYFNVVYQVRNAQFCGTPGTCTAYSVARQNLTLIAAATSGNLDSTAVSALSRFDGSAEPSTLALQVLPTHGAVLNSPGTGVLVQPGFESLQVYSESEIAGIPLDTGATGLFPYGYVVKNINNSSSRALPASPAANQWDGQLAFSFKVPLQSTSSNDPWSITLVFQVVDDSNTRVTQSVEEQSTAGDATATARAVALGSTDLVVLGGRVAETNIGDPVCTVRTAGAAGSAMAHLVNYGSTPTVGSAPYNIQFLAPAATLDFGFCAPMAAPAANAIMVSGSQSGLHSGTIGGASSNRLTFPPDKAFLPGETVSYSLTTALQSTGNAPLTGSFVGSFLVGGVTASSGTFDATPDASFDAGSQPLASTAGDLNGDGFPDLIVTNFNVGTISVLMNNRDGTFAAPVATPVGSNSSGTRPNGVAVGDFNRDGKLDLVVVNNGDNNVSVLLGDGSGGFGAANNISVASGPNTAAVADFNGDGIPDLAVFSTSTVSVLPGVGNGTFGTAVTYTVAPSGGNIVTGDFNGDGKPDLAIAYSGGGIVGVMLNNGSGGFANPVYYNVGNGTAGLAVGDFNNDGWPDIAVANGSSGNVSVLLNSGNGTFGNASNFTVGSQPAGIGLGDFNGDGKLDMAVANSGGGVSVLLGNGSGGFGTATSLTAGTNPSNPIVGSFTPSSGRLDLAVVNLSTGGVSLFLGKP